VQAVRRAGSLGPGIAPLLPEATLQRLREVHHPRCFVGRDERDFGPGVRFDGRPDGGVEATVGCPPSWEGYGGMVQGGIIASLLDGAMTNALFARGTAAVTVTRHPDMSAHRPRSILHSA
jgi:hypothetical protein